MTTCGSGVTAAVLLFAMHLLGKDDVALYDGSWSEWGADPGHAQGDGAGRLSARTTSRASPPPASSRPGGATEWTGAVVNPPVWRGSTHLYADSADLARGRPNEDGHFYYGRRGSPTQWALAEALTELEPGAAGTRALSERRGGDRRRAAGGARKRRHAADDRQRLRAEPRRWRKSLLAPLGIETRFFDPLDVDGFAALFDERTRAVLLESPGSLTMEVCDIPALAAIAREQGRGQRARQHLGEPARLPGARARLRHLASCR